MRELILTSADHGEARCRFTLGVLAIITAGFFGPAVSHAQTANVSLKFGVVGDVPYGEKALAKFPELVESIEASASEFIIHVGDIKAGSATCSDEMLSSRIDAIDAIKKPVVFIPGDNDWTDCHRRRAGRFAPLERLNYLRSQAYSTVGQSLGTPPLQVNSQASQLGKEQFPEHQQWVRNGVSFITLHVLGSANGLATFGRRQEADDLEASERIAASIEWLDAGIQNAIDQNSTALVVAIHANPFALSKFAAVRYELHPYAGILLSLTEGAARFNKPVLLIHGDTHNYKFDQPFPKSEDSQGNIHRLEGIGSPTIGWVEVLISNDESTPFEVTPYFIDD